jgi:hypothetical protein
MSIRRFFLKEQIENKKVLNEWVDASGKAVSTTSVKAVSSSAGNASAVNQNVQNTTYPRNCEFERTSKGIWYMTSLRGISADKPIDYPDKSCIYLWHEYDRSVNIYVCASEVSKTLYELSVTFFANSSQPLTYTLKKYIGVGDYMEIFESLRAMLSSGIAAFESSYGKPNQEVLAAFKARGFK